MAAGLGFKTFTTGEVLTAADTNGYLMQGILVFASAAARDAAITSPQEGQFAYLKDTNVTTYYTGSAWANVDTTGMTNPMTTTGDTIYSSSGSTPARLGIGSTGQVLTVAGGIPSWATASTGALTYVGGSTFSASATVNVNNLFSATYSNYRAYLFFNASANSGVIKMRMRVSGSDDTNSTYSYQIGTYQNETYKTYAASSFELNPQYINPGVLSFDIFNPFASERTIYTATGLQIFGATDLAANFFAGVFTNTTSFTGLTLFSSNATTLTGTLRVYGLANS